MSNLNAIGLISAFLTAGVAVATYVMARILDGSDTVVTGVRRGVTVSTRYRWIVLFHNTLPFLAFLALYLFVGALCFVEMSRNVSEGNVQMLAQLCAALAGFASFSVAAQGVLWMSHLLSVLRQAEAD